MYKIIGADGKEYGPVGAEVVRQWLNEGRANAQTRVLPEGAAQWKALGDMPEFAYEIANPVPPRMAPLTATANPVTNPLAIFGLVLGIISVTSSFCCYGLPFNLAGIVLSLVALAQIKAQPQKQQGKGLAVAGLVLSIVSIVLAAVLVIVALAFRKSNLIYPIHRL